MMRPHLFLLLLSSCCLLILLSSCSVPRTSSVSHRSPSAGTTLSTYSEHRNAVSAVAWSPDGKRLASASYDKSVQIWKVRTAQLMLTYHGHFKWVTAVAWSPDGKELASAGLDTTVQIWNATTSKTLLTYLGHSGMVTAIAWSPCIGSMGHLYKKDLFDNDFYAFQAPILRTDVLSSQHSWTRRVSASSRKADSAPFRPW